MSAFEACHPAVSFFFFVIVIAGTVWFQHPLFLAVSFFAALLHVLYLKKRDKKRLGLFFMVPAFFIIAVINPLFSHRGVTILWYFGDNPITMESILYGISAAMMLMTVLLWFISYNKIITSDKFLYLFGKLSPAVALIFSMSLRLVPKIKHQANVIAACQKGIGKGLSTGNFIQRIESGGQMLSSLTTWTLENAIETADSMKARGYGLHGRSTFSLYRFTARDTICGIGLLLLSGSVILMGVRGMMFFQYYPFLKSAQNTSVVFASVFWAIICCFPLILQVQEEIRWTFLR
jgi:energy-coupling factor transport system permease protein